MITEFEKSYDKLFVKYLESPSLEIVNQLETIKRDMRNQFSSLMQNKKEMNFIKLLYSEGKSNANQFSKFKSKKTISHKLNVDGNLVTGPAELVKLFSLHHKEVTASHVEERSDYSNFEDF